MELDPCVSTHMSMVDRVSFNLLLLSLSVVLGLFFVKLVCHVVCACSCDSKGYPPRGMAEKQNQHHLPSDCWFGLAWWCPPLPFYKNKGPVQIPNHQSKPTRGYHIVSMGKGQKRNLVKPPLLPSRTRGENGGKWV